MIGSFGANLMGEFRRNSATAPRGRRHSARDTKLRRRPDLTVGVDYVSDKDQKDDEQSDALTRRVSKKAAECQPSSILFRRLFQFAARQRRTFGHHRRSPRDGVLVRMKCATAGAKGAACPPTRFTAIGDLGDVRRIARDGSVDLGEERMFGKQFLPQRHATNRTAGSRRRPESARKTAQSSRASPGGKRHGPTLHAALRIDVGPGFSVWAAPGGMTSARWAPRSPCVP